MITLIVGIAIGVVVDNIFAPKVRYTDGKVTVEWHNPSKPEA